MTRGEDLQTLGLSDDEARNPRRIRLAFLRLTKVHHPDKGGTNEGFQKLSEAYYRLRAENNQGGDRDEHPAGDASGEEQNYDDGFEGQRDDDYDYYNFWQNEFFSFFRQSYYHAYTQSDDEEEAFHDWEQEAYERKKQWSQIHRQQLKTGVDFRDVKAKGKADACIFCGKNKPIKKKKAESNGVDWDSYVQSVKPRPGKDFGYNTCWVCKTNHDSVLTEAMAKNKFAKKLKNSSIFMELRSAEYTFTAQPRTDLYQGETRVSEYFWYPDLEAAALASGWKPRGKMKGSVPWQPKNRKVLPMTLTPKSSAIITPDKKRKRPHNDDDDKKPSAKRKLL